jgi:hypothetical protein
MTLLEDQLVEALVKFMTETEAGIGIKEMSSLDGRIEFYDRIQAARDKAEKALDEYNRQQAQENNRVTY